MCRRYSLIESSRYMRYNFASEESLKHKASQDGIRTLTLAGFTKKKDKARLLYLVERERRKTRNQNLCHFGAQVKTRDPENKRS